MDRHIEIEPATLSDLIGNSDTLSGLRLVDSLTVASDALYLAPPSRLNPPPAERLGWALHEGPFGPVIRTDAAKLTTVAGIYAAGDIARAPHNVSWAVADGVTADVSMHEPLVFASLAA